MDDQLLIDAYNNCDPRQPLDSEDEKNLDLDATAGPRGTRWAYDLAKEVRFARTPLFKLFSGQPGSGKSTELRRLLADLRKQHYLTVLIDGEEELDLNSPLDAMEVLAVVVYAAERAVLEAESSLSEKALRDGFTKRILDFLGNVDVELTNVVVGAGPLKITALLKTTPSVRKKFRLALAPRKTEFLEAVREYASTLEARAKSTKLLSKATKSEVHRKGIVVAFDSLEKLGGAAGDAWNDIINSAADVFLRGAQDLQRLPFHTIYTVPTALTRRMSGVGFMYSVKVADRDGLPYEPGVAALLELVKLRVPEAAMVQMFGDDPQRTQLLTRIIENSGGYLRDVLRTVQKVAMADDLPVDEAFIEKSFQRRVSEYGEMLTKEDIDVLADIERTNDLLPDNDSPEVRRLIEQLLAKVIVLRYQNTNDWYGLHPAVTDKLRKLEARRAKKTGP
jgi:hypothetical protein